MILTFMMLLIGISPASAQDSGKGEGETCESTSDCANGLSCIDNVCAEGMDSDDGFKVEGELQKPDVFMILSEENASKAYELVLRESFVPKILESMKNDPL